MGIKVTKGGMASSHSWQNEGKTAGAILYINVNAPLQIDDSEEQAFPEL